MNRQVRKGDRLYVLTTTADRLAETALSTTEGAIKRLLPQSADEDGARSTPEAIRAHQALVGSLKLICDFTCTARTDLYREFGHSWQAAAESIKRRYPRVPIIGGLCAGEFGIDQWRRARANGLSFWVNCFASSLAPRADTRELQSTLLTASERLSDPDCKTPKQVMEAALQGAIATGETTGGQICIVDEKIIHDNEGLILGCNVGCAVSARNQGQDWEEVAKRTIRRAPKELGGSFPRYLLSWSMPVKQIDNLDITPQIPQEEDILTLIVRTLRAVFVHDASKRMFHCNRKAAKAGKVTTLLAIPLIGSTGRAIATLQVGFPDHYVLDRESFGLWVGYAQRVAAALERAQEAEEREITRKLSELGNDIVQRPPDLKGAPYQWCKEFLHVLLKLLGAAGAHMRLVQVGMSGAEFPLISAVGHLSELRRKCRPVTHEGEGSCNRATLEAGGKITNSREETDGLNKDVRKVHKNQPLGKVFCKGLQQLEATAMLPVKHEGVVLGSLVIDSTRHYFFTERWKRIARAAAETAGLILSGRNDGYNRGVVERAREWLVKSLAEELSSDASSALQRLLKRLCDEVKADVGSLFLWHEPLEKLILHTSYGWWKNMDGKASYTRNEGWTGSLAFGESEISSADTIQFDNYRGARKYLREMIPPQHRRFPKTPVPRIGIRLEVGDNLVGVATFAYTRHPDRFAYEDKRSRTRAFLSAMADLLTLAVEDAKNRAARKHAERLTILEISHRSWCVPLQAALMRTMFRVSWGGQRAIFFALHGKFRMTSLRPWRGRLTPSAKPGGKWRK